MFLVYPAVSTFSSSICESSLLSALRHTSYPFSQLLGLSSWVRNWTINCDWNEMETPPCFTILIKHAVALLGLKIFLLSSRAYGRSHANSGRCSASVETIFAIRLRAPYICGPQCCTYAHCVVARPLKKRNFVLKYDSVTGRKHPEVFWKIPLAVIRNSWYLSKLDWTLYYIRLEHARITK